LEEDAMSLDPHDVLKKSKTFAVVGARFDEMRAKRTRRNSGGL
jgi:hypothetical protein